MSAIEIGKICVKSSGRESGNKCVIVDLIDKNFVLITGPKTITGVKRRRANINHLEPFQEKLPIKRGASDEEIVQVIKDLGKLEEMMHKVQ